MKINYRQHGLGLIELMIATTLSIALLSGVYQIYIGSKQTYLVQSEMARLQENARFAMNFLATDIRKAGYTGCLRSNAVAHNVVLRATPSFIPFSGLQGWEASNTAAGSSLSIDPVGVSTSSIRTYGSPTGELHTVGSSSSTPRSSTLTSIPTALPNSDIIRVWFGLQHAQPVKQIYNGKTIKLAGSINTKQGDIIMLSDCGRVDYVMLCNNSKRRSDISKIKISTQDYPACANDLNNKFLTVSTNRSTARRLNAAIYFIGKSGAANRPTGLYKRNLRGRSAGNSQLVSEGIENMQILYGEDTDRDQVADVYLSADGVTDWNAVINVKVSLLLSTADYISPKQVQAKFKLNGTSLQPKQDRRLRRVFTTTISLRNRA